MEMLGEAIQRGVIVITVTQCTTGSVSDLYETGKAFLDLGIIPGNDLTSEAALTKLSYVLSKPNLTNEERRKMMEENIRGEMTILRMSDSHSSKQMQKVFSTDNLTNVAAKENFDLVKAVATQLHVTTSKEVNRLREVLFPSVLNAIVTTGQTGKLDMMHNKYEADLSMPNYDGRTPLHVAAAEGQTAVLEYLLKKGAGIHVRDRNNDTPLMCAIKARQRDSIRVLRMCGAHLQLGGMDLGEKLCALARVGSKKRISCFKLAGANLNIQDFSGQTMLHAAAETGQDHVVQYLLENQVDQSIKDDYGRTAFEVAMVLNRTKVLEVFNAIGAPQSLLKEPELSDVKENVSS